MSVDLRTETADDAAAIRRVHVAAFPAPAEADLVDALRDSGRLLISLVAELDGEIVGHVAFSPVTVHGPGELGHGVGLAPVAVLPARQNWGIGGQLIREGLSICRQRGDGFVVVLGHPEYYPRFGFLRADRFGLTNEYGATDAFMFLPLKHDSLPTEGGLVKYCAEFASLAE